MKKILFLIVLQFASSHLFALQYRTSSSGNFSNPGIWETSTNSVNWIAALTAPTDGTHSCTIQSGDTVVLDQDVIFNDNTLGTAPSITVHGTLIFDNHFIEGEPALSGGSAFNLLQGATLDIKNETGLRNGNIGALRNFSIYSFDPLANYIFSGTANQSMYLGIDSSANNLTIHSTATVNSNEPLIIYGSLNLISGTFHLNHTLSLKGNGIVLSGGTITTSGNAELHYLNAAAGQSIPPGINTLKKLTLNTTSNTTISLNNSLSITGYAGFKLLNGKLHTGSNYLLLHSDEPVQGHATSYVIGHLKIMAETFSETHNEQIVFPIGVNAYQPIGITVSTPTNAGPVLLSAKVFETKPTGSADKITLGDSLYNRYWNIKNESSINVVDIDKIELTPTLTTPSLGTQSKIAVSLNNLAKSFNALPSSVVHPTISTTSELHLNYVNDLISTDGLYIGIGDEAIREGVYCIGPSASYTAPTGTTYINANSPYPTITSALSALHLLGNTGPVTFELQQNYVSTNEATPISVTYKAAAERAIRFTVRSDASSPVVIEKGASSGLGAIVFDGATNITIDGTIGNALCHSSYGIIVRNTLAPFINQSGGVGRTSISFKNDARNIRIKGLQIEISDNGISFDNSIGLQGCDSITIECNVFKPRADLMNTNIAAIGILFSAYGSMPTVTSNDIRVNRNYFENCNVSINVGIGLSGLLSITNNSMYRSIDQVPGPLFNGFIHCNSMSEIRQYQVTDNYFGGSSPMCSGTKMNIRGVSNNLSIFENAINATTKSIYNNNHFENIHYTLSNAITAVRFTSGIWDIIGNLFGNLLVPNDIQSATASSWECIRFTSSSNATTNGLINRISGNLFNHISMGNATGYDFYGILYNGNVLSIIDSNRFNDINSSLQSRFYLIRSSVNNVLNNQTNYFRNNIAEAIQQNSATMYEAALFDMSNIGGTSKWEINGNRIGSLSAINDIVLNAPNIIPLRVNLQSGISRMDSNIVCHLNLNSSTNTTTQVAMDIMASYVTSFGYNQVYKVASLAKPYEAETGIYYGGSLTGMRFNIGGSPNTSEIHHNLIRGVHATNTILQTNPIGVIGMLYRGVNSANPRNLIHDNTIDDLTNLAVSSGANPYIQGIHFYTGHATLYNNRIALSNAGNINKMNVTGIYKIVNNIPFSCYHNSISITGTSVVGSKSFALKKGGGLGQDTVKNNIFQNTRNGSGLNYAIGNLSPTPSSWGICNYNNIYNLDSATIIESLSGVSSSLANWRTVYGRDVNSKNLLVKFIDSSNDLHISTISNCGINDAGNAVNSVLQDIDGELRSSTLPDLGADEFNGSIALEAGSEKYICIDSLQLQGQMPTDATGYWTGNGVTFTPNHTSPNATVHGLSNGLNNLVWHVSNAVCVAEDTLKLHVGNLPAPITTTYLAPICHDREVQISLGSPLTTGAWSTGDTSQTLIVYPSSSTTYSVTGTDIYNCPVNYSLLVETIPLNPLLSGTPNLPIHTDLNIILPVTMAWNPGYGSDITHLLLWKSNEIRPNAGDIVTNITTKQYSNLDNEQEYYWQIMSMNVCDTVYSDTSSFTTNMPDLIASDIAIQDEVYANSYTAISWKVKNNSTSGNTNNITWNDYVGLTPDTLLGITNYLSYYQNLAYLTGGASYQQQKSVLIPQGLFGKYYVAVHTDANNHLFETNELNNFCYDSIIIKRQPVADIKIVSLANPGNAFAGDSILMTYTVENDGEIETAATLWQDEVFISHLPIFYADSAISCGFISSKNYTYDTLNGNTLIQHIFPLQVDSTYFSQHKIKLPTNLQSGLYYLYIKVNKGNTIQEGIYSNNNITKSPVVLDLTQLPPADLIIDTLFMPLGGNSGKPITISWRAKNQGSAITAVSNWTDRVYINTTNSLTGATLLGSVIRNTSLPVDSTYIATLTTNLPNGISGNYYVMVKTDASNTVFEYIYEDNNLYITANTLPIQLSPSPDLIVSSAYFTNDTAPKSTIVELNYTLKNTGTVATSGLFTTNCFYNDSVTYGGNKQIIAVNNQFISLGAGDSVQKNVSFYTPPKAGTYYYSIHTDVNNTQYEHNNELNNIASGISFTAIQPIPTYSDVKIDSFTTATTLYTQQSYSATFTVKNYGPHATSGISFVDQLYLSTDQTLDANDTQIKQEIYSGSLDSNQAYTKTISYTIPDATLTGSYYLILQSDKFNSNTNDTNKIDNINSKAITVTQTPSPDLEVISIIAPDTLYPNQTFWLIYTVRNNGPANLTTKNVSDRIYFSTNNLYVNPYNAIAYSNNIRTIPVGNTYTDSVFITVPSYATSYYYFMIKTDNDNLIYENGIENNNLLSKLSYVNINSGVDIVPVALSFPADTLDLGSSVDVTYGYTNIGTKSVYANLRNAIHLSNTSSGNAGSDYMLNYTDNVIQIPPGDTLYDTIQCIMKDATTGRYESSIRLNTTLSYPEDSIQNNTMKGDSISIDITELIPNISSTRYLKYGDLLYYRLHAPADNDLAITINQLSGTGQNVGRISFEQVPSLGNADIIADDETKENQILLIPGTSAGDYYLLINNKVPGLDSQLIQITAQFLPLTILSITNDEGGQGEVTTTLTGASFRSNSAVKLTKNGLFVTTGSILQLKSTMEMDVLWNLTEVPLGIYDVEITNGTSSAILNNAFTVELAEEYTIVSDVNKFGNFSVDKSCGMITTFTNIGNTNIPLLVVGHTPYGIEKENGTITEKELFEELYSGLNVSVGSSDAEKQCVLNLKPSASVQLKWTNKFNTGGDHTYGYYTHAFSKDALTRKLFNHAEDVRKLIMEYLPDNHPELIPLFADRSNFYNIVMEPFIIKDMISLVTLQELIDLFGERYIDFDPGAFVGTQYENNIELKSTDIYRWEINVPTTTLGGEAGKEIGWDLLRSFGDINITATPTRKFEIVVIPKSPCSGAYTSLTTWEPWHDYKWAIAVADGSIQGFDPSKFIINSYFFDSVNNTYGGHFELSVQNDSLFLEFKHKERVLGEHAYNGGPGICGFPGGNGENDVLGGQGGDGGRGWGIGSAGGNGGKGHAGGGAGGLGYTAGLTGSDGLDTDLDNDQDGIPDNIDACPNFYSLSQVDTDGDGIGDACDPHPSIPDIDTDGDGILDDDDNSPLIKNPGQEDTDKDGIPDVEDNTPNWKCLIGITCPKAYDCIGEECEDEEIPCTTCAPSSENPQTEVPSATDKCNQYLEKLGCPRAAIGCFKGIMAEIASNGGSMDPFSTIGAKNKALLTKAYLECGLNLLDKCLGIKVPLLSCALAATDAVSEAMKLKPTAQWSGQFATGPALGVSDNCFGVDDVKIACGIFNIFFPKDPNEIRGPEGNGDTNKRWIPSSDPLLYTISFENDSLLATTSAERVLITQQIPANLNPLTFKLGTVSFQNMSFDLPKLPNYTGVIDVDDSLNYDVEVTAGLDIVNQRLFWVLQTIDPLTGLPPNITNGGFLPVNDASGKGQGSVTYSIRALSSAQTQDTVAPKASIIFDTNPAIETNTWKNTFDVVPPNSSIDTLPALILNNSLLIPFTSQDDTNGSGVEYTKLFVQVNESPFQEYGMYFPTDTAEFTGIEGCIYGFYTQAIDTAGNKEPLKSAAQWTVQFGYPDSIKLKSALSNQTFCEQDVIPIMWHAHNIDSIHIQLINVTNGSILYTSGTINGNDTLFNWTVPAVANDTVIFRLTKIGNNYYQDEDTIIINHLHVWYQDEDDDHYSTGLPVVSCTIPGFGFTTTGIIAGNDCNDQDSTINPGSEELCCNNVDENCNGLINEANLSIKLFLQGYYLGSETMSSVLFNQGIYIGGGISDTVEVLLIDTTNYTIVNQVKALLSTHGELTCGVSNLAGTYYLAIRNRNSVETWSAQPITITFNTLYDFTTAANKAYGSNQAEVEPGKFAFYSGDVNQDENVDLGDLFLTEIDITNFEYGYRNTDINGDGSVDLQDLPLLETNSSLFIFSSHP